MTENISGSKPCFKEKLWEMASKLRNNIDTDEYNRVVRWLA